MTPAQQKIDEAYRYWTCERDRALETRRLVEERKRRVEYEQTQLHAAEKQHEARLASEREAWKALEALR